MRKRIAIINQRYGDEVNGGSEYYTKKLAEHLNEFYDVEVITTTALDYDTWKPYYPVGLQKINGVSVRRFAVERPRDIGRFKIVNKLLRMFPGFWKVLEPLWLKEQGPYCPQLIEYIKKEKNNVETFVFVTYLYYTTVMGLPEVAQKAVLVPTAHDEYCIYFHMYEQLFRAPKGIVYLTEEEETFTEAHFNNSTIPHVIAGSGIEVPLHVNAETVKSAHGITEDYLIYVGRVDTSKKCDEMFAYFEEYKKLHPGKLKLVLVGKLMMDTPHHDDIVCLGFVSEEEKYQWISGAKVLILPSEHESLSLAVLEAMAMGVPVLVNGACKVLKAHCEKSGAGYSYNEFDEFQKNLETLLNNDEIYKKMQNFSRNYVHKTYNWKKTVECYRQLIEA